MSTPPPSDLLLHNGHFITLDPTTPYAKALAIKNGRIIWIGDDPSDLAAEQYLDLKGAFVYPGFIDSHIHLLYVGLVESYLQLHDCSSKAQLLVKVQEKSYSLKPGEWIIGVGWDDHTWPDKGKLTALELDQMAPHNPVMLLRKDSHLMWVNTLALSLAGIDRNTPDLIGGIISRDSTGVPTGILIDNGMVKIRNILPFPSLKEKINIVQDTLHACLQRGITSIHNAATDQKDFEVFHHLAMENQLSVRIYGMVMVRDPQENPFIQQGPKVYTPFLQMRCLKLWMDGAMGSRGAALMEPYADDPTHKGLLLFEEKDLLQVLQLAKEKGFQVAIHAIGDRANHVVLNAYQKVGVNGLRWRIEHAQQLLGEDLARFAQLGVIASMQPVHYLVDKPWLEDRLGCKRIAQGSFSWRSLVENGAILCGGSDAPVADFNPLLGMYAATTRENEKERLTRMEALKMYTINAAYASFSENDLGSLSKGKLADLIVFPENLLTSPTEKLLSMEVLYTFVEGKIVYKRN